MTAWDDETPADDPPELDDETEDEDERGRGEGR